jgi:hypothetical protein
MRPMPYTTPAGATGTLSARARGNGRAPGRAAARPEHPTWG